MANVKLNLLQSFDRLFGAALCRIFRPAATGLNNAGRLLQGESINRILVIRPGGLGDAALAMPMLEELRRGFPDARIDVLAERRNAGVFEMSALVSAIHRYDTGILRLLNRLRSEQYDIVVDTEQFHHLSILFANYLRPKYLCGFSSSARRRFQTHTVTYSEEEYEAQSFLNLAGALLDGPAQFAPENSFLVTNAHDDEWVTSRLVAAAGRQIVAIAPLATGPSRLWPVQRYAEVAERLIESGCFIVVLGGADATSTAVQLMQQIDPAAALNLAGQTSLAQTTAILRRAQLLICTDTGVLHLAAGVNTPTVAMFGSGLHNKWAPKGRDNRMIRKGLACSPCISNGRLPPCPHGFACMLEIETGEVLAAARNLLNA